MQLCPGAAKVTELYGMALHPLFAENHWCYVCYKMDPAYWGQIADGTRVSRFTVTQSDPPKLDPASEQIVISWLGGGHNGGCLQFGPEGYLYISSGDGGFPNPPDPRHTGQDIGDLLSSVLRIDVDHEQLADSGASRPYTIPADNPFVDRPGARGEIWAYGFRNPWKISFDRATGDLWAGDVGWELWELADRVVRGGNYGWSVTEGLQPVYPDAPRSHADPAADHRRAAHRRGLDHRRLCLSRQTLAGAGGHVCLRRLGIAPHLGVRVEGSEVAPYAEIALPGPRIVAFGEDPDGELLILDFDHGTIHELIPNPLRRIGRRIPHPAQRDGLVCQCGDADTGAGRAGIFDPGCRLGRLRYGRALGGSARPLDGDHSC